MSKVQITREQAEAITKLREQYEDDNVIFKQVVEGYIPSGPYRTALSDPYLELLDLASALLNGYEVIKTPEEKVRELYESYQTLANKALSEGNDSDRIVYYSMGVAVLQTLEALGVKIKGVNDESTDEVDYEVVE